ncbi:MAG: hypothetical protein Q9163_001149 [Psora crenata]
MSLENVKHIVLVLSGKGGVGKSSVTTQLALSLTLAGKSVGILDVDLTGPSIPRLLGLEDAKITQLRGGWKPVEVHAAQALPPLRIPTAAAAKEDYNDKENNNKPSQPAQSSTASANGQHHHTNSPSRASQQIGSLHATSLAFLLPSRSSAVIWRGPKKTAMVRQFLTDVLWPPLDYLLIDTPPGTSDEHISLAETLLKHTAQSHLPPGQLAGAVVVTTPQAVSLSDVRKEINFCRKTGIEVLGVVENMSGYVCECCGERTNLFGAGGGFVMSQEFGVRFLGGVPLDQGWGRVVEEGEWARYGAVANNNNNSEGPGAGNSHVNNAGESPGIKAVAGAEQISELHRTSTAANNQDEDPMRGGDDRALLVDRYRSCQLCEVFKAITKQLIEVVEEGPEKKE